MGCPLLDELLRGGLPVGVVTELSGESGAGKTQLALQLCLSVQFPAQHGGLGAGKFPLCPRASLKASPKPDAAFAVCRSCVRLHRGRVPQQASAAADPGADPPALPRPPVAAQLAALQRPHLRGARWRPGGCGLSPLVGVAKNRPRTT